MSILSPIQIFLYLFLFFSQLRNEKTAIPSNFPNKIQCFPYMTTLTHNFIVIAGRFSPFFGYVVAKNYFISDTPPP